MKKCPQINNNIFQKHEIELILQEFKFYTDLKIDIAQLDESEITKFSELKPNQVFEYYRNGNITYEQFQNYLYERRKHDPSKIAVLNDQIS